MPASQLLAAKGAKLKRLNPSTLVYEDIPQCTIIAVPSITVEYLKGTNHDSPDFFAEYVDGERDGGDVPFEMYWNPAFAIHVQLFNDMRLQTLLTWRAVMNNVSSTTFQFTGRVSKFDLPLDYSAIVKLSSSVKVTANPTLTP